MRCLTETFGNRIQISGEYAGLHLLVSFDKDLTEKDLLAFRENEVEIDYVEDYTLVKGKNKNRIVLGYGGLSLEQLMRVSEG